MEQGDEILYPEYICDVTLVPCQKMGITTRFYPVDERLNPDLIETKKLITQKTKAFLSVNYFGFPQPFEEIRQFCKENNLIFIEDNAHGFLSRKYDLLLGSFGDISVFSFRKTLETFNGAALVINNRKLQTLSAKNPKAYFGRGLLKESDFVKRFKVLKWYIERVLGRKLFKRKFSVPRHGSTQDEDLPYLIDDSSLKKINTTNPTDEIERRRGKYSKWLEFSKDHDDLSPLFPTLPDGVCPQAAPFLTSSRDKWLKWGDEKRLNVSTWPTLPFEVSRNSNSKAVKLWEKLLLFPLV
jgi:perosamine synthetase